MQRYKSSTIRDYWDTPVKKSEGDMPYFSTLLNTTRVVRRRTVLELGCGTLKGAETYFGRDKQYVGGDISGSNLMEAAIRYKWGNRYHERGSFVKLDMTELPFKNDSFDIVTSFDTVSALGTGVKRALREMKRVARDEIIFTVLHRDVITERALYRVNRYPYLEFYNFRGLPNVAFTEDSLGSLLRGLNMRNVKIETFTSEDVLPFIKHSEGRGEVKECILATIRV